MTLQSESWQNGIELRSCPNCDVTCSFGVDEPLVTYWCEECGEEWEREIKPEDLDVRQAQLARGSVSDQEAMVLALKERDFTHNEIASKMDIEKGTVDTYSRRAREKYLDAKRTVTALEGFWPVDEPDG